MSEMCSLEALKIDLNSLDDGETTLNFHLGDTYFQAIGGSEVSSGEVDVMVKVSRVAGVFQLGFHVEGVVSVPCDICLDDMSQPISGDYGLTARLGEAYSEDDDLITVEREEGMLDLSWFIYEFIALSLPLKHVHGEGECNPAMLKTLEEYSARNAEDEEQNVVDPRWSELEKLKQ